MMKKTISEICDDPNFIDGIYNYCDRWCERCAFTSRCANFALGNERFSDSESNDLNNEEFWKTLSEIMAETKEMILQGAAEMGIDLNNLDEVVEMPSLNDTKSHLLIRLCMKYEEMAREWFTESFYVDQQTAELIDSRKIELDDAIEVIHWYMFQIDVKLRRALLTLMEEDEELSYEERNGSAKVALIGLDRSLEAWNVLLNMIKDRQKSILDLITLLNRIKLIAEKQFPQARNFIRPGLDE